MDECQHAMEELRNIVEGISNLRDTAYAHYSLLVEQVLKDQITDEQQLEQIMDGPSAISAMRSASSIFIEASADIFTTSIRSSWESMWLFSVRCLRDPMRTDLREDVWR